MIDTPRKACDILKQLLLLPTITCAIPPQGLVGGYVINTNAKGHNFYPPIKIDRFPRKNNKKVSISG